MRFTVVWTDVAILQLARGGMQHPDTAAVDRDVEAIDDELAVDPDLKGGDYFGDRGFVQPQLWALYRVVPDDRIVYVLQVGRTGFDRPHENLP